MITGIISRLTALFPVWAILFSWLAYRWPAVWAPHSDAIVPLLSAVMFCMGLTLSLDDFRRVAGWWRLIGFGLVLQYAGMPLAGWAAVQITGLEGALAVGVILVGCCPGGTASNVICYLARGDVALSVALTACSTILAVLLTPLLAWAFLGQMITVPLSGMMGSVFKVVILPVGLGIALNSIFRERLEAARPFLPFLAMSAIVVIIALIVAVNAPRLADLALPVILAVILHNFLGLALGYGAAFWIGAPKDARRTLSIETGMQNSGLAAALAALHFSPLAALAAAVFSIWHNLSGSALAVWWSRR